MAPSSGTTEMTRPRLRRRLASAGCPPLRSRARACSRWVGRWTSHVASFARSRGRKIHPDGGGTPSSRGTTVSGGKIRSRALVSTPNRCAEAARRRRAAELARESSCFYVFLHLIGARRLRRKPQPLPATPLRVRDGDAVECAPRVRRHREVRRCGSSPPRVSNPARTISCGRRSLQRVEDSAADEKMSACWAMRRATVWTRRGASSRTVDSHTSIFVSSSAGSRTRARNGAHGGSGRDR